MSVLPIPTTRTHTNNGSIASEERLKSVLSARTRPPHPSALSASLTLAWRAVLKIKHVPLQLFDVTAFPVMMTLMFTYLFGGALAGSPREYIQFLLPGILVQTVIFITLYTGVALNTDIQKGIFDRFRSLPIWRPSVIVGALLCDVIRYTIAATVVIGLGLILGFRPQGGVTGVAASLALILMFCFSLSWVWTVLGLIMPTPESVMGVSSLIMFPLTFVSNIFVDPTTMPTILQKFVDVNPITQLVMAVRGLMHGTVDNTAIMWVFVACAVIIAIFAPLTMRLYYNKNAH